MCGCGTLGRRPCMRTCFCDGNCWSPTLSCSDACHPPCGAPTSLTVRTPPLSHTHTRHTHATANVHGRLYARIYTHALLSLHLSLACDTLIPLCMWGRTGTWTRVLCGHCQQPMAGAYCDRCERASTACAVCRMTVRGPLALCVQCGHGGHPRHWDRWFAEDPARPCPTGCGCVCRAPLPPLE